MVITVKGSEEGEVGVVKEVNRRKQRRTLWICDLGLCKLDRLN